MKVVCQEGNNITDRSRKESEGSKILMKMVTVKSHRINLNHTDFQTTIQIYRISTSECFTQDCAFNKIPSNFCEIKVLDPIHEEVFGRQSPSSH